MDAMKKRREVKKAFLNRINRYDSFNKLISDLRKQYRYDFQLYELEDYKVIWQAFKRHQEHDKRIYKAMFQQVGYVIAFVIVSILSLAAFAMV